ncbi:UbiA prenyltransferase family protein [Winogradskyella sp. PC D3.3]
MGVLKRIFNFYLNSSIHVALAACSLAWVTLIEMDIAYDTYLLSFVFFATITGYNFVKYFGIVKFHHRSLAGWLKALQVFSFIAFLAMCYFVLKLEFEALMLIVILGIITFFYAIPIMVPKKYLFDDHKNLRQVSGLKVYLIALIWTFTTVLLPMLNNGVLVSSDGLLVGVQRFCYILVLMLPFEIRDLNYDSLKLATIPQKIGVKNTKVIGVILLVVFLTLEFFKDELLDKSIIAIVIITAVTLLFLLLSNKNQSKYFSAFWVEGLPIVWLLILLLLR